MAGPPPQPQAPAPPLQNSEFDPVAALNAADAASKRQVDPQTVVGVANSAKSVGEAIDNVQAIAHSGNMVKLYDTLSNASVSQQVQAWQALAPSEQASLQSLGYQAPHPDVLSHAGAGGQHGGVWSAIMGGASDVLHGGERFANDALSALGAPLRAVQHVYRAGQVVSEMGVAAVKGWDSAYQQASGSGVSFDPSQFKYIFSPTAWAQAWRETNNGNTQIDPAIHRHLVGEYGNRQVSLAIQVANEGNDAVVQSLPQAQRQAMVNQLQDPKFQALVTQVTNSRISVGRAIVGERFLTSNPTEGKLISGAIDAGTDILSDPTMQLGKVSEALNVARYGAQDASRARDIIQNSPGVARLISRVAPYLEQGRYGELGKLDSRFNNIAESLQAQNIDSAEKFKDWLSNTQGMKAIFSGQAAKISHTFAEVPHLSYMGWAKAGVKEALGSTLDKLAFGKVDDLLHGEEVMGGGSTAGQVNHLSDLLSQAKLAAGHGNIPGVSNVARLVRRMITNIPSKPFISTAKGDADVTNFRRYLEGFLPTRMVDQISNVFVAADEGQRRILVSGAMRQQAHAAGLYNTATGADAADRMFDELDGMYRHQAYSVNGLDKMPDETGLMQNHALLETQKAPGMAIPLPSVMRKLARANSVYGALGVDPFTAVDKVMALWRAMILDRPGFAVRFALEENTGRLLRSNPKALLGSWAAGGAAPLRSDEELAAQLEREVKNGTTRAGDREARMAALRAQNYKPLLPYHPVMRALNALANRAPEGARSNMKDFAEFYGGVMGGTARRWARKAEGKGLKALGLDEYIDGATHYAKYQPGGDAMHDLMAAGTGDEAFVWSPTGQLKAIRSGAKGEQAFFKNAAPYSVADAYDPAFRFKWQMSLDSIARSKLGRAVLESITRDRRTQTSAVLHVLNDPEFAFEKQGLAFAHKMRDGRMAGVDATQDEVDKAFARQIVDHVNAHVRSGKYAATRHGPLIDPIVKHMLETGSGPDHELLEGVDQQHLPQSVYGPDIVQTHTFAGWLSKSFEELAGKPMNWMTRQPHWIHQYTEALRTTRPLAEEIAGPGENAEQLASDLATQRATNAMTPYIHNPELRTQFEDYHRNLFPFLFAQRQFLQRWGRTFADSPSAVRKMQLTMNGMRTTGIVRRDPTTGDDYFYYPGSQYVTEMISHTLNRLGMHATIPFAVPFTGEVKYLVPGLANPITPSVGPFAAVSMKELAKVFPEMTGFNQSVLGQGAAEGNIQQFLPTVVNRLYNALGPAQAGSELASAMAMEMKYLDAAGYGLPNNATPGQIERYVARLQNGARQILLTRALLGFVLPATPTAQLDPNGLDARYKQLLGELPYSEATAQFIKEHPDANAYTVGDTMGQTEGGIPSTAADLAYTNAHIDFATNYPAAFPWLAPRSPGTFSLTEYIEQEATGQRVPKPIYSSQPGTHSLAIDIINARSASAYYATVNNYEKDYTAANGTQERRSLTNAYDNWKTGFMKRNPIFAQYIASQSGHVSRVATIDQVRQALSDPQLPDSPAIAPLRQMLDGYDSFISQYEQWAGNGSQTAYDQKQSIKQNAIAWGTSFSQRNPAVADFWNTVIRPEVDEQTG